MPKGGWRETGGTEEVAGLLYDLGSHLVDQALRLLGPAVDVYAESDVRRSGVNADDDTFIAISHAGGARSHLWASSVASRLGPRFRVLGSRAGYLKYGLDVQEEQLRAGLTPASPGFGEEPPERWGTLGADGGGSADVRAVPTEPGAYAGFYRAVVACLRRAPRHRSPRRRSSRPSPCWRPPAARPPSDGSSSWGTFSRADERAEDLENL